MRLDKLDVIFEHEVDPDWRAILHDLAGHPQRGIQHTKESDGQAQRKQQGKEQRHERVLRGNTERVGDGRDASG